MKTKILVDTNYSFIETITNEKDETFSRKLEQGSINYSNACIMFHQRNVKIEIGNTIEF